MTKKVDLNQFLELGLRTIYQAEKQIYKSLEVMAGQSSSPELQDIFTQHRVETGNQIQRLQKAADLLSIELEKSRIEEKEGILDKGKEAVKSILSMNTTATNKAMEGLIEQGQETIGRLAGNEEEADLALSAEAQLIEEFEILSYQALCAIAEKTGHSDVKELLQQNLEEEKKAFEAVSHTFDKELEAINL